MDVRPLLLVWLAIADGLVADLTDCRSSEPLNAAVVARLVERSGEFGAFRAGLDARFRGSEPALRPGTVRSETREARDHLRAMTAEFMMRVYGYALSRLREYVARAADFTEASATGRADPRQYAETIALAEHHEHCMATALYDFFGADRADIDVDLILDASVYLQTFGHGRETYGEVAAHLSRYLLRFDRIFAETERVPPESGSGRPTGSDDERSRSDDDEHPQDAAAAHLLRLKPQITDFSNMFCSAWPPFVAKDVMYDEIKKLKEVQNPSPFLDFILRHETFVIYFKDNNSQMEVQQSRIKTWDCDHVLESEEYRFKSYKHDITIIGYADPRHLLPKGLTDRAKRDFTLHTLKRDYLIPHSHYLNLVRYYNVASEVMLSSAIKEGRKILKGIKHVVATGCRASRTPSAEATRRLGATLYTFKTLLDEFAALIAATKRINVAGRPQKAAFDLRAGRILDILNPRRGGISKTPDAAAAPANPDDRARPVCAGIAAELADLANAYFAGDHHGRVDAAVKSNDRTDVIIFDEYYFCEPIKNLRKLYAYVAHDF